MTLDEEFFRLWRGAQKDYVSYTLGIVSLLQVEGQAPKVLRLSYEKDLCSPLMYNATRARLVEFLGLRAPDAKSRLPVRGAARE